MHPEQVLLSVLRRSRWERFKWGTLPVGLALVGAEKTASRLEQRGMDQARR